MTDAQLLFRILNGRLVIDRETLQVRNWDFWKKVFRVVNPDRHPISGRYRFRFGPRRRTVYRNRLVWMYFNRRVPTGFVDHIDGDRTNDRPENLRDQSQRESYAQGRSVQRRKYIEDVFRYFEWISFWGEEPPMLARIPKL